MTDSTESENTKSEVKPGELDPEIWNNPTLGAAVNSVFLDQLEAQQIENRAATVENRPARIAKRENRYPGYEAKPNEPVVTFGSTYADGSRVVPAVRAPEQGYGDLSSEKAPESADVPAKVTEKPSGKTPSK